jgi:hypothetical protein
MGNTNSLNQTESINNPKKNEIENNIKLLFKNGFDTSSVVSEDKFTEDYNNFIVNQLGGSKIRKNNYNKKNRFEKFKHIDNLNINLNSENEELNRIKSILENNQFGGDSDYEISDMIFTDSTDKLPNNDIFEKINISEKSNKSVLSDTSNVILSNNINTNELSETSVDNNSLSETSDRVISQNINNSSLSKTSVSDNVVNNLSVTSSFNESIASNLSDTSLNANQEGGYLTESTSENDLVGGEIDNPLSEKEEQNGGNLSLTSSEEGLIGGNLSLTSSDEGLIGGNLSVTSDNLDLENKIDNFSNTSSEEVLMGGNNLKIKQNSFEEQQIPNEFKEYINNIPEVKYHDIMSNNSQSSELDTLNFNKTEENLNMDYNMNGGQLSEIKSPTESVTSTENNEHNDINILPFYTEDSVSINNRNLNNNKVFN